MTAVVVKAGFVTHTLNVTDAAAEQFFFTVELSSPPRLFAVTNENLTVVKTNNSNVFGVHINHYSGGSSVLYELYSLFTAADYGSLCFEAINCTKCDACAADFRSAEEHRLAAETFHTADGRYRYGSVAEHACEFGKEFNLSDGSLTAKLSYQCHWNGSWLPAQDTAAKCTCT